MFARASHHNIISGRHYRKAIAMVQLLVMLMLAVPVCCYELAPEHEKTGISQTANANDAGHDKCPCCPDDKTTDIANCATCSYCSYYAPLTPAISTSYNPSAVQLIYPEQFTKLADVHIPIFVPPQNLA